MNDSAGPPAPTDEHRVPVFNAPPATLAVCAVLAAVHLLLGLVPSASYHAILESLAFVPERFFGQFEPQELATLVTYAFVHHDLMHLLLNVGFLLAFGSVVERALGMGRWLLLFALSAAAAALAQSLAVGAVPVAVIGASGAVYGMLGAAVPYLYAGRLAARRRSALAFIAVVMGLNLLFGLIGLGGLFGDAEVAWQAHIGGFVAGLLLVQILAPRHGPFANPL